jgi:HlyD family secretion protein
VTKGQLLAVLDDVDLRQQVEVAQAGIAAAHASLDLVIADKRRTEAILEQARRDYQRSQNLTSAQVSTSEEFEKASEALAVAEAGIERAEAAIMESHKQILTAERTLAYHQARLTDTRMEAPFDGLIVKRHRDPGDVAVPGTAVLSLIATDVIWVSAWVDETEMARLAPGQKAEVVFRSEPEQVYQGEVLRLGRESDRETREFVVDVQVLSLPEVWAVGQRAEVYIETDRKENCTVLPQTLVLWKEGQPGVFMEADGKATWKPLSLGLKGKTLVEILEGASPGDGVISPLLPNASSLAEGRRVKLP